MVLIFAIVLAVFLVTKFGRSLLRIFLMVWLDD